MFEKIKRMVLKLIVLLNLLSIWLFIQCFWIQTEKVRKYNNVLLFDKRI